MKEIHIINTENFIPLVNRDENKTLRELNQVSINYLYKKISENKILNDNDIELYKLIKKD